MVLHPNNPRHAAKQFPYAVVLTNRTGDDGRADPGKDTLLAPTLPAIVERPVANQGLMSGLRAWLLYSLVAVMPRLRQTCMRRRDACFIAGLVGKQTSSAPRLGRSMP